LVKTNHTGKTCVAIRKHRGQSHSDEEIVSLALQHGFYVITKNIMRSD